MVIEIANFHLEVGYISRKQGRSPAAAVGYIFREKIDDNYYGLSRDYRHKMDVVYSKIYLPPNAPTELHDPQIFVDRVDAAENRVDSRTLRSIRASLPNELTLDTQIELVDEYVADNFVNHGMCVVAAIHEGRNDDPSRNNPHVHLLLTTRSVTPEGFSPKKSREWDRKANVTLWREQWANVQNRAYERTGLDVRVSHESYIMQGKDQEAKKYLNRMDYGLERRGIQTARGDENRAIQARNKEREVKKRDKKRKRERGISR